MAASWRLTWRAKSLRAADPVGVREPIDRAGRWLLGHEISTVTDAAVMLMATAPALVSLRRRRSANEASRYSGRASRTTGAGGRSSPLRPEVFDTALALIALARAGDPPATAAMIARGRAFLIAQQQPDGSWIETTRPPGAESYAQRISTTGWAALALLATREAHRLPGSDPKRPGHVSVFDPRRDRPGHVDLERPAHGVAARSSRSVPTTSDTRPVQARRA